MKHRADKLIALALCVVLCISALPVTAFAEDETPAPEAAEEPTAAPTAIPTEEPTEAPTPEQTAVPPAEPTAAPAEEPAAEPEQETSGAEEAELAADPAAVLQTASGDTEVAPAPAPSDAAEAAPEDETAAPSEAEAPDEEAVPAENSDAEEPAPAEEPAETHAEAPAQTPVPEEGTLEAEAVSNEPAKGTVASGTCGDNLTWTLDDAGTLTISGSGAMDDFDLIDEAPWWEEYRDSIKKAEIKYGATSIGTFAFMGCTSLTNVTVPTSVKTISEGAFNYCTALTTITIPSSVNTIGQYAFQNCNALKSITIPESVTTIETAPFIDCSSLTSITVATGNTKYCSKNGVLFSKDAKTLIQYPAGKTETAYSIPSSVTTIAAYAFHECTALVNVTIPSDVTRINKSAFCSCSRLKSVTIPSSVSIIGEEAFGLCSALKSVTIPSSVKTIGRYAFQACTSLSSVTIPSGVTSIEDGAFYSCSFLTSVTIMSGVTAVGARAFSSCFALKRITFFGDCPAMEDAFQRVTAEVHYLAGNSTYTADKLIDYGGSLTWIGDKLLFTDVTDPDEYFLEPVYWAVNKDVTTGTTPTTFSPYKTCTRGQIITFIWRVLGSPEPESYKNPFKDVKSSDYFYKPVLWSYYKGINYGKTPTTFGPYLSCTREQAMTFLYRAAGKPGVTVGTRFKDVKTGQFYTEAVYWALDQGITTGQTETTFGVGKPCTRGQIITFLYRYAKLTGRL